jgi:hypothetical protein
MGADEETVERATCGTCRGARRVPPVPGGQRCPDCASVVEPAREDGEPCPCGLYAHVPSDGEGGREALLKLREVYDMWASCNGVGKALAAQGVIRCVGDTLRAFDDLPAPAGDGERWWLLLRSGDGLIIDAFADEDCARRARDARPEGATRVVEVRPFPARVGEGGDAAAGNESQEVVMDATGIYWRRYPDGNGDWLYGMLPVSDNPDPIVGPLAVYRLVGHEQADRSLHLTPEDEKPLNVSDEAWQGPEEKLEVDQLAEALHITDSPFPDLMTQLTYAYPWQELDEGFYKEALRDRARSIRKLIDKGK